MTGRDHHLRPRLLRSHREVRLRILHLENSVCAVGHVGREREAAVRERDRSVDNNDIRRIYGQCSHRIRVAKSQPLEREASAAADGRGRRAVRHDEMGLPVRTRLEEKRAVGHDRIRMGGLAGRVAVPCRSKNPLRP